MPETRVHVRLVLDLRRSRLQRTTAAHEALRVLHGAPHDARVVVRLDPDQWPDPRVVEQLVAVRALVELQAPDGETARLWQGALTGELLPPLWERA